MLYMTAAYFAECFLTKYMLEHVVHAVGMIHPAVLHIVHRLAIACGTPASTPSAPCRWQCAR